MTQLYWDNFADEVVTDPDTIAPPERYVRIHCGSDVFIEKWAVDDNDGVYQSLYHYLDIAYSQHDCENGFVNAIRRNMEERYIVHLSYMTDWTVPKEHYKKMKDSLEDRNETDS